MEPAAVLSLMRRRWIVIAVCLLVGVLGSAAVTATTPKSYQASARLFVNIPAARGVQEALQGVQLSSQLISSYAKIATSRAVAERVSAKLDHRFSAGAIRAKVSAHPQPETLLVDIVAVDQDPAGARDIANAEATTMTEVVAELETGQAGAVEAKVIDPAVTPGGPISPKPKTELALGIVLGLVAGFVVAALLESLDRSITTNEQAVSAYGAPVLASIPRHRRNETNALAAMETSAAAGEAYRSLRTSLRFVSAQEQVVTIVVTSAEAGAGKTTVAANLAVAIAQAGESVIVVDADLRRPKLAALFDARPGPGLTDVVLGRVALADALVPWRGSLQVLPAGELPPNPSEVLGSEGMAALLAEAGQLADVVILDAAPLLPVTDAAVLAALCDGVLVVSRWGVTEVAAADEGRFVLEGVAANVAGVALNAVRGLRGRTYYRDYRQPKQQGATPHA